jgi:23S rRNA-/tRNA-specific pseudouridylate synthase
MPTLIIQQGRHSNKLSSLDAETTSLQSSDHPVFDAPNTLQISRTKCLTGVAPRAGPLNQAVAHIILAADGDSNKVTLDSTDQDHTHHDLTYFLNKANDLIAIGAVWARMEALDQDDVLAQYYDNDQASGSSRAIYADLAVSWTNPKENPMDDDVDDVDDDLEAYIQQMEALRFRRVLTASWIEAGTDIRVYPEPRRFPACAQLADPKRLLYQDTTFIVVDKPPMMPTQADASNYQECVPGSVETYYGPFVDVAGNTAPRPILCHRVDSCVGGCVVLSKDRNGQKVFQDWQQARKLRKVYLAVTTQPVPLGMNVMWMWSPQTERGQSGGPPCQLVRHTPPESRRKARQFWNRCVLEVVKCERIDISADDGHGYDPAGVEQHYQSTIRLVTGRKHQVRAQLAGMGCPIIRDTLYEPMSGVSLDSLEVDAEGIMDTAVAQCRVPSHPIGLQAHAILFGGIRAKAGTPWWGNRVIAEDSLPVEAR